MDEEEQKEPIREPDDKDPHPSYPGLTYGDVRKAQKKAASRVEAERKAEILARIEEEELARLNPQGGDKWLERVTEKLPPSEREMVNITLSLAPQMPTITIDGRVFRDRMTHTVPRAIAREMQHIQFNGWRHESVRKGDDSYAFYAQMARDKSAITLKNKDGSEIRTSVVINTAGSVVAGAAPRGTHG